MNNLPLDFKNNLLILVDGHALIHRAFHALPPLTNRNDQKIGAVYGFLRIFFKVLKEYHPEYIVVAFDSPGPTFRHDIFPEYKATRAKTPDELNQQIPLIKEAVAILGFPILEIKGFEADDLIGTLAKKIDGETRKIIVTGDTDLLQLADENIKIILLQKGISQYRLFGPAEIKEKYQGLTPRQLVELKGLKGDPSDNLPGIPGIGEKTGRDLLLQFEDLENIYENLEDIPPRIREKLIAYKEQSFLSRKLGLIYQNAPVDGSLENYRQTSYNKNEVINFLTRIGLKSLIKSIP